MTLNDSLCIVTWLQTKLSRATTLLFHTKHVPQTFAERAGEADSSSRSTRTRDSPCVCPFPPKLPGATRWFCHRPQRTKARHRHESLLSSEHAVLHVPGTPGSFRNVERVSPVVQRSTPASRRARGVHDARPGWWARGGRSRGACCQVWGREKAWGERWSWRCFLRRCCATLMTSGARRPPRRPSSRESISWVHCPPYKLVR
jgi:hypothetical protein